MQENINSKLLNFLMELKNKGYDKVVFLKNNFKKNENNSLSASIQNLSNNNKHSIINQIVKIK